MPKMTIVVNDNHFDKFTEQMHDQAEAIVRRILPAEGDHSGTPLETDVVRRHPFGKCTSNFLIEIEAGDDPTRQRTKEGVTKMIGDTIAKIWGRYDIAVRLRLQDGTFYVYQAELLLPT